LPLVARDGIVSIEIPVEAGVRTDAAFYLSADSNYQGEV